MASFYIMSSMCVYVYTPAISVHVNYMCVCVYIEVPTNYVCVYIHLPINYLCVCIWGYT